MINVTVGKLCGYMLARVEDEIVLSMKWEINIKHGTFGWQSRTSPLHRMRVSETFTVYSVYSTLKRQSKLRRFPLQELPGDQHIEKA